MEKILCPECKKEAEFKHVHDTAHGIPQTHMAGSERFVCTKCSYTIFKEEGVSLGLIFVLD